MCVPYGKVVFTLRFTNTLLKGLFLKKGASDLQTDDGIWLCYEL